MFFKRIRRALTIHLAFWSIVMVGCGSSDVSDLANSAQDAIGQGVDQVKETVTDTAQQVKDNVGNVASDAGEVLQQAGKMEVTLDAPLTTNACYVQLIRFQTDRPSVLQMRSYRDARSESFPSVFVRAELPTGAADNLAGQTVAAQMFVKTAEEGATWFAADPVQLKITTADDNGLTAEIGSGSLANSTTGTSQNVVGTFTGVMR